MTSLRHAFGLALAASAALAAAPLQAQPLWTAPIDVAASDCGLKGGVYHYPHGCKLPPGPPATNAAPAKGMSAGEKIVLGAIGLIILSAIAAGQQDEKKQPAAAASSAPQPSR